MPFGWNKSIKLKITNLIILTIINQELQTIQIKFREPYLQLVRKRNQRLSLTWLRVSAHQLATELDRRTQPVTPYNQHFCSYCQTSSQPNQTSNSAWNCLLSKLALCIPGLKDLTRTTISHISVPNVPTAHKAGEKVYKNDVYLIKGPHNNPPKKCS